MFETIKKMFKEEEEKEVKLTSEQFDKEHGDEIRERIIKLHEELKRVCKDNGIMMVEYYNFDDLLKQPSLYMVFDLEAIIIDVKRHAEKYREELKDGAEHTIECTYPYPRESECFVIVSMCARLMTKEEEVKIEVQMEKQYLVTKGNMTWLFRPIDILNFAGDLPKTEDEMRAVLIKMAEKKS